MNLTEFLLSRIAEDEAAAHKAAEGYGPHWFADQGTLGPGKEPPAVSISFDYIGEENADHAARWDPARVLAECEAKRGLLRHLWVVGVGSHDRLDHCDRCQVIRYFGEVYAGHPDYRDEWRP